jgi:hypothetical protein
MEVNHLVADVNGANGRVLRNLKTEPAIELQHSLSVLHRKRNMIETSYLVPRLLRISEARTGCAGGDGLSNESAP